MTIPSQIDQPTLDDCLEVMTQAVFQAGVSWAMVENKWPAFRKAFSNFQTNRVAKFTENKIDKLASDESILRSRKKIAATVENARMLQAVEDEFGSMEAYFATFNDYNAVVADLQSRFKYMGDMNCYYFLFRLEQPVPKFEKWVRTIPGDHPRMREMVKAAKPSKVAKKI